MVAHYSYSSSLPLLLLLLFVVRNVSADIYILDHIGPTHSSVMVVKDRVAAFGQQVPMGGLHGRLVEASPLNGCHKMEPAPPNISPNSSMIAVIARYSTLYLVTY